MIYYRQLMSNKVLFIYHENILIFIHKDDDMKRGSVMNSKERAKERRTCSKTAPFIHFFLESTAIVIFIYVVTLGDIFSRLGLILVVVGLVYPVAKLPVFVRRVAQCRRYMGMEKER